MTRSRLAPWRRSAHLTTTEQTKTRLARRSIKGYRTYTWWYFAWGAFSPVMRKGRSHMHGLANQVSRLRGNCSNSKAESRNLVKSKECTPSFAVTRLVVDIPNPYHMRLKVVSWLPTFKSLNQPTAWEAFPRTATTCLPLCTIGCRKWSYDFSKRELKSSAYPPGSSPLHIKFFF